MKIGILMGGISSEREISLKSGEGILQNIDKERFKAVPIVIDSKEDIINKTKDIDFALLALHGKFGEDGTVQSILETLEVAYSGCGSLSSSLCMNKDITKKVLNASDINTARWITVTDAEDIDYHSLDKIGYPFFVKPNSGGSSVATNFVDKKENIKDAVIEALKYDDEVMIEEYIKGEEISCSMIDGKVYPIIAIRPTGEFFDFKSKYTIGGAEEVVVELEEALQNTVEKMAKDTWKALKCSAYARVDMIIRDNIPFVLEVNTLPGMGQTGILPQSLKAAGVSYKDLVSKIIDESLKVKR